MSSGTNDAVCNLMAENGNMKNLLCDLPPEMESRLIGLGNLWPCVAVNFNIHRNELLIQKIKEFTKDFTPSK